MIQNYVDPIYWDKDKLPGDGDWNSIFSWINNCPIVLVIVSKSVIEKGLSVGQEVGYARKAGKVIIPFISKNVKRDQLGCLKDLTAIHYDETNPQTAIKELETAIQKQKEKLQSNEAMSLLAIGSIILLVLGSKS